MNVWTKSFIVTMAAGLALGTGLIPRPAAALSLKPMTVEETVHEASAIFVGRVLGSKSRWGDASQRWIVTDYSIQVQDAILPDGTVQKGRTVTLTFWGGTIGEETQEIAGLELPKPKQRCVMMLREGWEPQRLNPTVGLAHGLFQEKATSLDGKALLLDGEGARVVRATDGRIARESEAAMSAQATTGVTLEAFTGWLRANVDRIKVMPIKAEEAAAPDVPVMKTFAKTPANAQDAVALSQDSEVESRLPAGQAPSSALATSLGQQSDQFQAMYARKGWASVPIVVNQFPSRISWSPNDQAQMVKWNYYANIFQVRQNPTGTYRWKDDVFDLVGFPSSDDLKRMYGKTWADEGDALAVCYTRKITSSGRIVEGDIALNPAYAWTLDGEAVYNGGNVRCFQRTMLHELGHMFGLDHNFGGLSVMNYPANEWRAYGLPFMDDAEAIRAVYPSQAQSRTDLGIYLFRSVGVTAWQEATFPLRARPGGSFTVNDYHLENVGTTTVGTPTVEWYLTKERHFNGGYYYLGATTYPSLGRFQFFAPNSVARTLTIPYSVPIGTYYLAAFIRNDGGTDQGQFPFNNNRAFSRTKMTVGRFVGRF